MTDVQENKKIDKKTRLTNTLKDLIVFIIIFILIFILSYFFDVFIFIIKFLERYPNKIVYIDEVITILLTISIGLAIFSFRRWLELKQETADRIEAQEALIRVAETKSEVERIINKQLQHEIEARANIEKELFKIIQSKNKAT